ncbi:MAG: single-stranded DNA-binding protein [Sandaracinaceae bacterium]
MASQGLNKVTLIGRVDGRTYFSLKHGKARLWFRLHCLEELPDQEGVMRPRQIWLSVVVWGPRAEALSRELYAGCHVAVDGRISHWKREGETPPRWETEIVARDVLMLGGQREPAKVGRPPTENAA